MVLQTLEIFSRFLLVFLLASLYGLQRQKSHKPIGFGAFTLVSIGACGLAIVAVELGTTYTIPLISAIVTGIGFLGAGALIKGSDRIFGFTTATSIWLFAIFGLIMGLGFYKEGFILYGAVWVIVGVDKYLEKRGVGTYRKHITVVYTRFDKKEQISNILGEYCTSFTLMKISVDKNQNISSTYLVQGLKKEISDLLKELYKNKWCTSVKLE